MPEFQFTLYDKFNIRLLLVFLGGSVLGVSLNGEKRICTKYPQVNLDQLIVKVTGHV